MSEQKKNLEETRLELRALEREMLDEEAQMMGTAEKAEQRMKEIALEFYPHLGEWDADLIRKVDAEIWRAADRFCRALAHADYETGQRARKARSGE
jgi:hypothetical protein